MGMLSDEERSGLVPAELAASRYAEVLREDPDVQRLLANEGSLHWSERWSFASDDPLKREDSGAPGQRSLVLATLLPAMRAARQTLNVISPYFVPGRAGTDFLVARAGDGIRVRILTNSLAATDVAAVHGGYSRYRDDLLAGADLEQILFELRQVARAGERRAVHEKRRLDFLVTVIACVDVEHEVDELQREVGTRRRFVNHHVVDREHRAGHEPDRERCREAAP